MKHAGLFALPILCAVLCVFQPVRAQNGPFDIQAYSTYLAQNANLTAGGLLAAHPSPLLHGSTGGSALAAAYLDSISAKYQLTSGERSLLAQNDFVVTERLRMQTFQQALYDVWIKDLPLFVSTDAILHALHMSYDGVLKHIEETRLHASIEEALTALRSFQPALEARYGGFPEMKQSLQDVDLYISVATALLTQARSCYYPANRDDLNAMLQYISSAAPLAIPLFSSTARTMDFSQFAIRGHYTKSELLGRYFQAMMWLGRTEFMLTAPVSPGAPSQTEEDIRRQVIDAALLLEALEGSGADVTLEKVDALLASIVGESDNVTPFLLRQYLLEAGVADAGSLVDPLRVADFQAVLATKGNALQRINSQIIMSDPMSPEQLAPPIAFLLMGQRFVIDSYVMANVVYDRIVDHGTKVKRMQPSSMDVLFAIGNNAAAQFLEDDLTRYHYAPNLDALRYLVDSHDQAFWDASLYNGWLDAVRTLNIPDDIETLPLFMQTPAWWQQKMNTQLASWAQLRHDNLLYAKPSYTGGSFCSYPEVYFEPIPELYHRLSELTERTRTTLQAENFTQAANFFAHFSAVMDTVESITRKELDHSALTAAEQRFSKEILYRVPNCAIETDGWFQKLIFDFISMEPVDIVTADVHTTPTDENGNIVGWILHCGTGHLNMGVFVAPNQNGITTAYVGPVLSYHEHTTEQFVRLTDEAWKQGILADAYPRPDWTNIYLADRDGNRRPPSMSLRSDAPPVRAAFLTSSAAVPEIVPNHTTGTCDPNPFPLTITATNRGNILTESNVSATIELPPGLSFAGSEVPDAFSKQVNPAKLFPDQSGTAQWMLQYQTASVRRTYDIRYHVATAKTDTSFGTIKVTVPGMTIPALTLQGMCPDSLYFSPSGDAYLPNPFDVVLHCVNTGDTPAGNVTGTLILPPNVALDNPADSLTKTFTPSRMVHWEAGDPIPELRWRLRWTALLETGTETLFRFSATGTQDDGTPLDSVTAMCSMYVPGGKPAYLCDLEIPDSLVLNAAGTGVQPNPFPVRYTIRNNGNAAGKIIRIVLNFPAEGLSLDPGSGNPLDQVLNLTLAPGESSTFEWILSVQEAIVRRNLLIQVTAYDENGNPIPCDDWLPIANLTARLSCASSSNTPVLRYLPASNSYEPDAFVVRASLRNDGSAVLHDLSAELWNSPGDGGALVELDPAYPDNTNPKTKDYLFPGQETEFTWGFRLKQANATGASVFARFRVQFNARELPVPETCGDIIVEIDANGPTEVDEPAAVLSCELFENHPNPFSQSTAISFRLSRPGSVTLVVTDALGRQVHRLLDAELRSAGVHSVRLDARNLRPGTYFYRLSVGGVTKWQKMQLLR